MMEVNTTIGNLTGNGSDTYFPMGDNSTNVTWYTQQEIDDYLRHLDVENAKLMIPTLIYIGILILTGFFGNILVILVYYFRFKPSTARVFIICLAIFDLMNNTMAQPGEIFDILYAYRFFNNHLCKLKRFFNYFTTFCSIFSLVVVAVDRHRKICKALKKQITEKLAKILVLIVVICSLAITLPSLMLNGVKNIPTGRPNIFGTECKYADNFQNALFPKIFLGFQFLLFLGSLTTMIVLYSLVGRTVFRHSKFNLRSKHNSKRKSATMVAFASNSSSGPSSSGTVSTAQGSNSSGSTNNANNDSLLREPEKVDIKFTTPVKKPETKFELESTKPSPGFDKLLVEAQHAEKKQKVKKMKTRTTLMLFVITLVFIVSYLPYLSISIVKMKNKNFVKSLSTGAFMVYNIVLRSHYINAAVNPLVYSFCNAKFRAEAKSILCFWRKQ